MSAGLGRLFNRVAGTAHSPVSKLQLIAAWPASSRIVPRPSHLGSSPLTVSRTAATAAGMAKATRPASTKKASTTTATKAAITKKTTAKKTAVKKAAPKKKVVKKKVALKKKVAGKKKAAPKKPVKKVLTPEKRERLKAKAAALRLKEKKARTMDLALEPPHSEPGRLLSGFNVYFGEKAVGHGGAVSMASLHNTWKGLPEAEKEKYFSLARTRTEEKRKAYRAFIETYTPEQIKQANSARNWLRANGYPAKYPALEDHRLPKRAASSFIQFFGDYRKKNPDIMNLPLLERGKVASEKWRSLSPQEKKPYVDLSDDAFKKYHSERSALFSS